MFKNFVPPIKDIKLGLLRDIKHAVLIIKELTL